MPLNRYWTAEISRRCLYSPLRNDWSFVADIGQFGHSRPLLTYLFYMTIHDHSGQTRTLNPPLTPNPPHKRQKDRIPFWEDPAPSVRKWL